MKKGSITKLLTVLPVLLICLCVLTPTAYSDSAIPLPIYGHVKVNGVFTSSVTITAGGSNANTDGNGYYQISPSVVNGSDVTVTADYQGHKQSKTVTQHRQGNVQLDFDITYSTPSPSTSPSNSPSTTPSNNPPHPSSKCTIDGTVRYPGTRVSGATVTIGGIYVLSGANGYYKMTDMTCGAMYTLVASYNNSSKSKTVTMPDSPCTVTVDFDLGDNGFNGNVTSLTTIIGTVTYNGTPAAWAIVSADNSTAVTKEDGTYELDDITSGVTTNVTATYNGLTKDVSVDTPVDGGTIVVNIEMAPPVAPTTLPLQTENSSLWIWLLLLALIAIAIAVAYLLYNRNK